MPTSAGPAGDEALPRVPLPELRATCERFLEWCDPLLDDPGRAATRAAVEEFLRPDSRAWALQEELADYDARPDVGSWLDDFWRTRYLGRRDRIALNANFFFLFPRRPGTQAERAAELTAAALDYKIAVDTGALEPPTLRGAALSAEQNKHLFSATRIPGREIDTSRSPYTDDWPGPSTARHVLVLRGGRLYRLEVLDEHGAPCPAPALAAAYAAVLADPAPPEPHPVGALTTLDRADWAGVRDRLRAAAPANVDALDAVEAALFCVALDDAAPADRHAAGDQLLHGAAENRWFDKAVSFVVFADGGAGINGEHCNLDGTTVATMVDTLLDPERRESIRARDPGRTVPGPALELRFRLDDALRADVDRARRAFRAFAADTASAVVALDTGAGAAKARGASPDGVVQMAVQLAHRRAKGFVGATYESIAMRAFRHGRTEAMRVVTPQSVHFVRTMTDPDAGDAGRAAALRAAVDAHAARARACQAGDAPEQHLWALQLLAQRRGATALPLYESPGWRVMRADFLSTSAVPSRYIDTFGFGSTGATCIGVAYVLLEDSLHVYLSTPRPAADGLQRFVEEFAPALAEVLDLLGEPPG